MAVNKEKLIKLKVAVENHKHQGKPVAVGTEIEVPQAVAKMLQTQWQKSATAQKENDDA